MTQATGRHCVGIAESSKAIESIENLIDSYGLSEVVHALALICANKAEHLRSNWQDEISAGAWEQASSNFGDFANFLFSEGFP